MMKLLHRTQRLFLQIAIPVFLLAGIAMLFAMEWSLRHFDEEKMHNTRHELETYVLRNDTLPAFFQSIDNRLYAVPFPAGAIPMTFSDTFLLNPLENEMEPFLQLTFPIKMRGQTWQIDLFQSSVEREDIAATIAALLLALFGLLFGVLLLVNRAVSRRVWQPFFQALDRMRRFRLTDPVPLRLPDSSVAEFQELHHTLEELAEKVQRDFRTVKQFTENASHELQTPIAVIQNKIDNLLQDETLSEAQMQQLDLMAQSTRRMARLNQTLLLLVKIENDQFAVREQIDWKSLLEKRLRWLEDFFMEKQVTLEKDLVPIMVDMNPVLAETLITNLLTNAVKHNVFSGSVYVRLRAGELTIRNTAAAPNDSPEKMTERFTRGTTSSEGLGLGLAMVREICEKNGFVLKIGFTEGTWTTSVFF
ncbi:MAG TPA: HAMP domain-containing sensor histidine kinase [Saprospiraceae bacterium]|jgi:signal transduction histidine kinase|nr:HAMP domain-containing sensor histidine kinase [Saprospiraceae bacterium]HPI04780.1 HAMP domain-containing sensor histidine kinase [Saprospiraceae bacterium]